MDDIRFRIIGLVGISVSLAISLAFGGRLRRMGWSDLGAACAGTLAALPIALATLGIALR